MCHTLTKLLQYTVIVSIICRCKYLRERDRSFHASKLDYPTLYYPEMYLLFGGYKVFYAECKVRTLLDNR